MINKKGRIDLKKYFVKNAIPTEGNFADLIDGMLNQKDDGITKPSGEPLSIEASASGSKSAIKFYESLSDPSAAWVMSLTNALGGKGFSIGGDTGVPRLVIDGTTGSVTTGGNLIAAEGISIPVGKDLSAGGAITASGAITANGGITVPAARTLSVAGSTSVAALTASGTISANGGVTIPAGQNLSVGGTISATGAISANGGLTIPAGQSLTAGGAVTVSGAVTVTGAITANGGITVPAAKTLSVAGSTSVAALTASGAISANGGLTIPAGQSLAVGGTISATGAISADGGLTVPSTKTLSVAGSTSVAAFTASGAISANGGLTIPVGQNLTVGGTISATGAISANGGLTIPAGQNLTAGGAVTVAGAITANGGITVPAAKTLTVAGSTSVAALTASGAISANGGISVPSPNGLNLGKFTWLQLNDRAQLNISGVGDALTVAPTGHVYVGSPSYENLCTFEVAGQMRVRGTFADENAGIWLKHLQYYSSTQPAVPSSAFIGLIATNYVGILDGSSARRFLFNTGNGELSITGANAWKPGGGAWSNSSDYRLKDEIRGLTGALDRLLKLRGVTFKWKAPETQGNQTGTQIGMIAQEVETVFPDWVSDDPNGYKGITIRGFEALVVEALRELRSELRALRGEPPEKLPRAFVPPKDMEEKPKRRGSVERKVVETYDYTDEKKSLLFQVIRYEPKAFHFRQPDGKGGWTGNVKGVRAVLYRLPEVVEAERVLIVEGEKDTNTAVKLGLPDKTWAATTSPGAVDWNSAYSETLRNKHVVICPDTDISGQRHLRRIVFDLEGKVASIRLAKLPAGVKDLSEWVQAGATKAQFMALIQEAQPIDSKSLPPL
ncbi:tail fiber domain-containing protein [Vitiosangium sp. GDMCC 1.1324]|uniref:tail fiber domain-containing protein n=1 Tax=Vitiosangium sp. (strain GDMCC 1.1324) TaxID=2138576 RepID=UPI000D3C30C0|nr:tail fiber domain-containing protein [Vitiosangium sp. GDMCC 1.1324]PTL78099.1 hypothetical protein DAT35_41535 [Vitiosangium sp. GDMCC 1.1324]